MLVFRVKFILTYDVAYTVDVRNNILSRWLSEVIEPNGLQFGGGGLDQAWSGVIETASGIDASESDRKKIESWLKTNRQVADYEIGPLIDDSQS